MKTDRLPNELNAIGLPKFLRLISFLNNSIRQLIITLRKAAAPLLVETFVLTTCVILAIRLYSRSPFSAAGWFVVPAVLALAAIAPSVIKRTGFVSFGLKFKQLNLQ